MAAEMQAQVCLRDRDGEVWVEVWGKCGLKCGVSVGYLRCRAEGTLELRLSLGGLGKYFKASNRRAHPSYVGPKHCDSRVRPSLSCSQMGCMSGLDASMFRAAPSPAPSHPRSMSLPLPYLPLLRCRVCVTSWSEPPQRRSGMHATWRTGVNMCGGRGEEGGRPGYLGGAAPCTQPGGQVVGVGGWVLVEAYLPCEAFHCPACLPPQTRLHPSCPPSRLTCLPPVSPCPPLSERQAQDLPSPQTPSPCTSPSLPPPPSPPPSVSVGPRICPPSWPQSTSRCRCVPGGGRRGRGWMNHERAEGLNYLPRIYRPPPLITPRIYRSNPLPPLQAVALDRARAEGLQQSSQEQLEGLKRQLEALQGEVRGVGEIYRARGVCSWTYPAS